MNTAKPRTLVARASVLAIVSVVSLVLASAGSAGAMYLTDGATEVSPGVYQNPGDGFCAAGLKPDGTLNIAAGITNARDCVAYTTGLTAMVATDVTALSTCPTSGVAPYNKACNVQANCSKVDGSLTWVANLQKCFDTSACTVAGAFNGDAAGHVCAAPNDGARHTYATSICINAATRDGISRVDLDNTAANCQEKGGVLSDGLYGHPYGACSAYGWQYGGVKSDGTLPALGAKGVSSSDNLGFCYTSMRMTSVSGYNAEGTGTGCPSWHNSSSKAGAEWTAGTDGTKYQSQASYDAGLGWSFSSSQCLYAYGVQGYINADLRGPDGNVAAAAPLCGGGTGAATAGTCLDLTTVTTQGDCLALGASWDNWLPVGTGTAPYATNVAQATTPLASTIKKLDATTAVLAGGAKFYSGTGSVCTRCHTDQSRAYQERQKPGYVNTGHKLSGDDPEYASVGSAWGLKGVQCEICHATGKPTAQDVGTIIYPTKVCVGGTAAGTACTSDAVCTGGGTCTAGVPRAASGHNQTEYGTHVTGVCFTCHGTAAVPETVNPAAAIPVVAGDLAPTAKNLAPIANEFLNSPHAEYTGSSNKLDIITKTNYQSSFSGRICRSGSDVTDAATTGNGVDVTSTSTCGAAGTASCNSSTNCPATPGGNRVWNAITAKCYDKAVCAGAAGKSWDNGTLRCVETQATCTAQVDSSGYPKVWSTTGSVGNPSLVTSSGAGCFTTFNSGSILTTYYSGGEARRIPNVDSDTNEACTSPTAGAGGFWTADGEGAGSTGGVAYPATDKGHCMTCHDVHWSLESTDAEAEPLRRECTTCHSNAGPSASGAPQIDLATINHIKTAGTPLENWKTEPDESCETCHMPLSGDADSSLLHLWRINTDPAYHTIGTTQVNLDVDGKAWVDIDHACGQCHGGGTQQDAEHMATPPALYRTAATLATIAKGMHDAAAVSYPVTFTTKVTGAQVAVQAYVNCGTGVVCPAFTYSWAWGDGATGTGNPTSHTYATAGNKKITLTLLLNNKNSGSVSRNVTVATAVDLPPSASATCVWDPNTWTVSVTDTSTDADASPVTNVKVDWDDASGAAVGGPGATLQHTYLQASTGYALAFTAIDSALNSQTIALSCTNGPVAPAPFTITGTVFAPNGTTPLAGASVKVKKGAMLVRTVYTAGNGTYSSGNLKPGTYKLVVSRPGYTFANPGATASVGGSQSGVNVTATGTN